MTDPAKAVRSLYRGVDAFDISKDEERVVRASRGSPVYGELTAAGCARLLRHLELDDRDVFYDLGAGSGKVVLQAAITFPLRKAVGVELAATRVASARRALRAARKANLLRARACAFRREDLLATYLADATVVYTCSTAFSARFLSRIARRLAELGRDLRFVTLQELSPLPRRFLHASTIAVPTTWARRCEVAVYHITAPRQRG